ncbi:hypothetical protein SAMD00019534_048290 [Acytostelium subglobosum LB1]|uniref:hypothetical protein n=1 Tax=Acytostelium subglobosum LB1 TaxID=1410327 RepID=UPI000644CCCA|nr:hypothetical protein SAMD00019534_048290 [Acytostelium subglobosum LB1]GAM21654.1 hypothetical protein SAMD00019534_048290 [Acytostelium subglobosum LB1]|eukprot:XP_012755773.1 hypothetical protein SAMD00019534_048290 [Acytostelium subglobosum LB1]
MASLSTKDGQLIKSGPMVGGEISVKDLPPGEYCVKVWDPKNMYVTGPVGTTKQLYKSNQFVDNQLCFNTNTFGNVRGMDIRAGMVKAPRYNPTLG